jgi:glutamate-ammonia-ligase adenylyltransferase
MRRRGSRAGFDVKLAPGGIRDIEFLVQCLQRLHGGRVPWVRHGGTMLALSRLSDKDLLSPAEYSRLASAYGFFRNIEHRLQLVDDRQTHILPTDPEALAELARKLPSANIGGQPSGEQLIQDLNAHLESVQEIYERIIHANRPMYDSPVGSSISMEPERADTRSDFVTSNLVRFLDQKAPGLASVLTRTDLRYGARAFEHFLEKVFANPGLLSLLDRNSAVARYTLDIFEHSPYFADEAIRNPDLINELCRITDPPEVALADAMEDASELRRWFRREMFRLQAASLCVRVPVFETLIRTSDLADAAIMAAYRMSAPKERGDRLMVISLGRLGMREFDLASDADLIFVIPDDEPDPVFWTRAANRIVDTLTAYTGAGILFAVDTRLRPNGGAGPLVQTESAYRTYFERNAEAWEGLAYMKSRAVAGDIERATTFLNDLQQLDWRRYGQSGRSKKDLKQMRLRLEREQGPNNPLKAGAGGFYDIDFVLLYLRLKSAGMFFKVLNTPARIDIIERMGHLERADAEFLRDASTFYRAVDHGLRLHSGHTEGDLPNAESHLAVLTNLVQRWTPEHLNQQPLKAQLGQIRARTREIFERMFG